MTLTEAFIQALNTPEGWKFIGGIKLSKEEWNNSRQKKFSKQAWGNLKKRKNVSEKTMRIVVDNMPFTYFPERWEK